MFRLCYYLFFDSAISMENVPPSSPLAAPMINLVAVLLNWGSTYIRGGGLYWFFFLSLMDGQSKKMGPILIRRSKDGTKTVGHFRIGLA